MNLKLPKRLATIDGTTASWYNITSYGVAQADKNDWTIEASDYADNT